MLKELLGEFEISANEIRNKVNFQDMKVRETANDIQRTIISF